MALQHCLLVSAWFIIAESLRACCSVVCLGLNPYCVFGICCLSVISSIRLDSIVLSASLAIVLRRLIGRWFCGKIGFYWFWERLL